MEKQECELFCKSLRQKYIEIKKSPETIILQKAKSYEKIKGPFYVSWELTSACNFTCKHCRAANNLSRKKVENLPWDKYKKVIDDLAENQISLLGITGGEPTLFPYFQDIVRYAKHQKIVITIYTNASNISEEVACNLSKCLTKDDLIHVSLDGGVEEDNDAQRGKGTFKRTIRGLAALAKYSLPIRLTIVPTIYNINNIDKIIDIAMKYNVKEVSAVPLMSAGRANEKLRPDNNLLFKKEIAVLRKLEKCVNIKYEGGIFGPVCVYSKYPELLKNVNFPQAFANDLRVCDAGTKQLFIDAQGNCFPCNLFASSEEFMLGNVFDTSISEIWQNKKLSIFKKGIEMEDEKCKKCKLWSLCNGGCMGLSWLNEKSLSLRDPRCI